MSNPKTSETSDTGFEREQNSRLGQCNHRSNGQQCCRGSNRRAFDPRTALVEWNGNRRWTMASLLLVAAASLAAVVCLSRLELFGELSDRQVFLWQITFSVIGLGCLFATIWVYLVGREF